MVFQDVYLFQDTIRNNIRFGKTDEPRSPKPSCATAPYPKGVFIAESPKVIRVALTRDAGYEPLALLCERKHLAGDAADIVRRCAGLPVYTGERELLAQLTGYVLTRGVLCASSPTCADWDSAPPHWP